MPSGEIHEAEIVVLVLLVFVVVFAALARKLKTPYPIVLVIAGLLLSFVPGLPKVALNPDVVFLLVLPPLLYSAAWLISWRDFKYNLVSIFLLAFGLVGFTVVGAAGTAHLVFANFDWRLGCVLGAVVATTDAIAATSIATRVGLPRRIVDILEGESLMNDATGLVALEFATAMVVSRQTPTLVAGAGRLLYLIAAGVAIGLIVGLIVEWIEVHIDDGPIEIVMSLLTPYVVYLVAESVRASGVLAVIACGLYLARKSWRFLSANVRLQAWAVWESLTFAINGLVFVLIGLQLPYVLAGIREYSVRQLLLYGAIFSATIIVLRLAWVYPGAYLSYLIRSRVLGQKEPMPSGKVIFVVGWSGMRGVLALAAALALPTALADGSPFPERNLIVFLTFSVILVTLVLQGLTLPPLIRALGLAGTSDGDTEEIAARRLIATAALSRLEEVQGQDGPGFTTVYDDIARHYAWRVPGTSSEGQGSSVEGGTEVERYRTVMVDLLRVERKTAVRLRNDGRINDEVLRKLEREIDLSETRLMLSS